MLHEFHCVKKGIFYLFQPRTSNSITFQNHNRTKEAIDILIQELCMFPLCFFIVLDTILEMMKNIQLNNLLRGKI